MKDGLYHKEVYWSSRFDNFFQDNTFIKIDFTQHVYENNRKAENRIYDINDITLDFIKDGNIFEVELKKDKIVKVVLRKKYTSRYDICMVFIVDKNILHCKTCWLNNQEDKHYSLDVNKYIKGEGHKQNHEEMTVSIFELLNNK